MPRKKRPLRARASAIATGWRLALPALAGAAATLIVGAAIVPTAEAKSPGTRYCFHGYCHRVGTLAQTDTLVGWRGYVVASYYDSCHRDRLNPCGLTSSGAVFRADLPDNAASPLLPDGTVILAYNPKTSDASVLRITNAGPYSGERKLDVSRAAADKLGFRKQGTAGLVISVLQSPTKSEANYVGRRVYPKVPGYLGKFATVDIALETAQARFDPRDEDEQLADAMGLVVEVSALEAGLVPRPQLAVSPSLARELVILRSPPQPVNRDVQLVEGPRLVQGPRLVSRGPRLVQGPRLVSQADFMAQQPFAQTGATSRTLDDGN
jgi:rare lipoprotein A